MKKQFTSSYNYVYITLFILCIPFFFLNICDAHPWGDDYAQYIKEAQNIAAGIPYYKSKYIFNVLNQAYAPASYPPGFPLMLAPVVKVFGIAIRPMCYLMSVIMSGLLFTFFFYFKKYMGNVPAICLALIGTYNGFIIDLKQNILSDIPLTLFVALYLTLRNAVSFSKGKLFILVLLAVMAILTRSQGIILLFAECSYLLYLIYIQVRSKEKLLNKTMLAPSLVIILGTLLIYIVLTSTIFYTPESSWLFYSGFFTHKKNWWAQIGFNANYLVDLLISMVHYNMNDPFWQVPVNLIQYIVFVFSLFGYVIALRKKMTIDVLFFGLMCLMILGLSSYQGLRFLLPVMPVFLLYFYTAIRPFVIVTFRTRKNRIMIALTVFYLAMGYDSFESAARHHEHGNDAPYYPNDIQAFKYIRDNINDTDIIVFPKPRALTLYTNKRSMVIAWQLQPAENKKTFDSLHVKYILVCQSFDNAALFQYMNTYKPVDTFSINNSYKLYRLIK